MSTDRPPTAALADAAHRSSGSFELVLGPVVMALIGLFIDSKAGTRPLFTLVLTVWGMAGAFVLIYYRYRRQMDSSGSARGTSSTTFGSDGGDRA